MKTYLICFILCVSVHTISFAQNGKLYVQNDPLIDSLIQKNKDKNKVSKTIDGYRIQLFSGADRTNATALKAKFLKQFPDIPVYMIYQQPFFKVRVGDFRNKLEAQKLYYQLSDVFGQVILVPDKINFPKL